MNNIICTTGGVPILKANKKALDEINLMGNCYWQGKSSFNLIWGDKTYSDFSSWQSETSQERGSGNILTGINADPKLSNPGRGVTLNNAELLVNLDGYKLSKSSPVCGKGINIGMEMGMDGGGRDFYGNKISPAKQNSIGAFEACK